MSRLQDISKMNLADLDRPGQTDLEEDSLQGMGGEETVQADGTDPDGIIPENDEKRETDSEGEESRGSAGENLREDHVDRKPAAGEPSAGEEKPPKKMMEPTGKHYYVDAELEEQDLVSFMLSHSYRQPLMIMVTVVGIIWPFIAWYKGQNMFVPIIGAACILILMPGSTYLQGKRAKKIMPIYQEVFHYMFDEWGMHLEVKGEAIDVEWKNVIKVVSLKSVLVLYTGKNNAFLVPVRAMGVRKDEITGFIKEKTGRRR